MTTKLNTKSLTTSPQQALIEEEEVRQKLGLMSVKDEMTKQNIPLTEFYYAVKLLNFPKDENEMIVNGDGVLSLEGTNPQHRYHSVESL